MPEQRYALLSDDDGHYWLIPVERYSEAAKALETLCAYWETADYEAEKPPELEALGFQRIDNPTCLTFTDPREDL